MCTRGALLNAAAKASKAARAEAGTVPMHWAHVGSCRRTQKRSDSPRRLSRKFQIAVRPTQTSAELAALLGHVVSMF